MEMSRLTRDETLPNPSRKTNFSGTNADREILFFPVQLTTRSRIGNFTRLIYTLVICILCDHLYIPGRTNKTMFLRRLLFLILPLSFFRLLRVLYTTISLKKTIVLKLDLKSAVIDVTPCRILSNNNALGKKYFISRALCKEKSNYSYRLELW